MRERHSEMTREFRRKMAGKTINTVGFLLELGRFSRAMTRETGEGAPIQLWSSLGEGSLVRDLGCQETVLLHGIITGGPSDDRMSVSAMMEDASSEELEMEMATGVAVSGLYTADASDEFRALYPPHRLLDAFVGWFAERGSASESTTPSDLYRLFPLFGKDLHDSK